MFVLVCGLVMTMGLVSCSKEESHSTSYHYRVNFASYLWDCDATEKAAIQSDFDIAVGDVGGEIVNKVYDSPQDEAMKAKCEAVKNKYTNLKSNYMKFELVRHTSNTATPGVEQKDVIAYYELGKSVQ